MAREQPDPPLRLDSWRSRRRVRRLKAAGLLTIKDISDASGLPQPVVAQLVPRTWTDAGWMYTPDALAYAVKIAPKVREGSYVPPQSEDGEPR